MRMATNNCRAAAIKPVAALCVLMCLCLAAGAQLRISPPIKRLTVRPGSTRDFSVSLINSGGQPVTYTVGIQDMGMHPNGMPFSKPDLPRGASKWLSADAETLTVAPGEMKTVRIRVKPPRDAAGGYYALVGFRMPPPSPGGSGRGVAFGQVVTTAVLVTCPARQIEVSAEVTDMNLSALSVATPWEVRSTFANTGQMHMYVRGEATLMDGQGRRLDRASFAVGSGTVLPGYPRVFTASFSRGFPDGLYTVKAEFQTDMGVRIAGKSASFAVSGGIASTDVLSPEALAAMEATKPKFAISTYREHFELPPGASRKAVVRVTNLTKDQVRLQPVLLCWDLDENADLCFTDDPRHGRPATAWLELPSDELVVDPGRSAAVRYSVSAPRAGSGEYYGAIFFREADQPVPSDAKTVRSRSVILTCLARGSARRAVEITRLSFERSPEGGGVFAVTVKNTGNALAEIAGNIFPTGPGETGSPLSFGGVGVVLVPQAEAGFSVPWAVAAKPGNYTATAVVDILGADEGAAEKDLQFTVPVLGREDDGTRPADRAPDDAERSGRPRAAPRLHSATVVGG